MDGVVPDADSVRLMSDPHDWNSWENYLMIHDKRLEAHPFVLEPHLEWTFIGGRPHPDLILLSGFVVCHLDVLVRVEKTLETRIIKPQRLQVRGRWYAYNAYFAGRHNILRYDNGHAEHPDEFHRHQYDLQTGKEISRIIIEKHQLPVLADFFTEVATIVGFDLDKVV